MTGDGPQPGSRGLLGLEARATVLAWLAVALLAAAPFLMTAATHAWSVPYLDDWAYLRIMRRYVSTGQFRFIDWNDVNFLGTVPFTWVTGKLLGTEVGDFRAFSVAASAALLAGIVAYTRIVIQARRWRPFAVATVLVYPPFGYLAVTLMTDLPSIACQVWCVVLGLTALPPHGPARPGRLALALGIGLLGFTIRQQAGVAPLAILAVLAARSLGGRDRRLTVVATCAVAAAGLGFTAWRATFPLGGRSVSASGLTDGTGNLLMVAVLTAGFSLPVLILTAWRVWPRLRGHRLRTAACASVAVAAIAAVLRFQQYPFAGNGVTRFGAMGGHWSLSGGRSPVFPLAVWLAYLACLAAGSTLALLLTWDGVERLLAVRRQVSRATLARASEHPLAVVLVTATAANLVLLVLNAYVNFFVFDRYVAPLLVLVVPALLGWATSGGAPGASPPQSRRVARLAGGLLAGLAVVSLAGTWDAQSFAAARWRAGERAVALGFPSDRVDAGAEWVGFFYRHRLQEKRAVPPPDGLPEPTYASVVPRLRRTLVVLDEPVAGRRPVLRVGYTEWFGLVHRDVRGYRVGSR